MKTFRNRFEWTLLTVAWVAIVATVRAENGLFDSGWLFHRGSVTNAETVEFNDKYWRQIDLPHDWSIEDLPALEPSGTNETHRVISGPFDSEAPGGCDVAFTLGGVGWYRKHFTLPETEAGKMVFVQFDGVYMDADVWLNGEHLGNQPYGYTSFTLDGSKLVHFGSEENVIAVRARNEGRNSRWYSGSGIYRHVWLDLVDPLHIAHGSLSVSTPDVDENKASIRLQALLENCGEAPAKTTLITRVVDSDNNIVATNEVSFRINGETNSAVDQFIQVSSPRLWSPESPSLYRVVCEVQRNGKTVGSAQTTFGIRSIRFDADKGFFLNGRNLKLKGGCVHANNGPLGAAAFDRAEERRVELLKAAGFNAIRCAHNPPSPAFLDACDRLGMMVIDETFDAWNLPHQPATDGYNVLFKDWWEGDLASMIQRDRNHPSIILWSIGNQIPECAQELGVQTARQIAARVRELDPARPVTSNVLQRSRDWRDNDRFFAELDVAGYSYARAHYDEDHQMFPHRVIFSSEIDPGNAFTNWMAVLDRDFVCGNFAWTAFDYMGEVGLGWWSYGHKASELFPWSVNYSGDLDICGFKRPRSYYRDALWQDRPQVSAFVRCPEPSFPGPGKSRWGWDDVVASWTWPERLGKPLQVDVYSSCEQVRLLLNGKDLGLKPTSRATQFKAVWKVPYESGTLSAIGYTNNAEAARWELQTAGTPARIRLLADRVNLKPDGQDLAYVTVEIVDANGIRNPSATNMVHFSVEGNGLLAAVGSSNPMSLESFQQKQRAAYQGRCLAIIRTKPMPGTIRMRAESAGLEAAELLLRLAH